MRNHVTSSQPRPPVARPRGATRMLYAGAALLAILAGAGCSGADDPGAAAHSRSPGPSPVVTSPYPSPPGGGEVSLVDQGFSVTLNEGNEVRLPRLTYGLVFENTSEVVAAFVEVRIKALDSSGKVLKGSGSLSENHPDTSVMRNKILYLLPGERVGVSDAGYMDRVEDARRVAKLEVKVARVEWWSPDNPTWCFSRTRATDVKLIHHRKDAGRVRFDLDVESEAYRYAFAGDVIFRDKRGDIVGGGYVPKVIAGERRGQAEIEWGIPLTFDPSKTEFYVRVNQPLLTECGKG